jgi:hypothetical protein
MAKEYKKIFFGLSMFFVMTMLDAQSFGNPFLVFPFSGWYFTLLLGQRKCD